MLLDQPQPLEPGPRLPLPEERQLELLARALVDPSTLHCDLRSGAQRDVVPIGSLGPAAAAVGFGRPSGMVARAPAVRARSRFVDDVTDPETFSVLIANERHERLDRVAKIVSAAGHEVTARAIRVDAVAAAAAEVDADVAIVAAGESDAHALELIEQLVEEASCPVILHVEEHDPELFREAARRGVYGLVHEGDTTGLEGLDRDRPAQVCGSPRPRGGVPPPRCRRARQRCADGTAPDRRA